MGRIGFVAIITGILMLIGSWLYFMFVKVDLPLYYRIAIILIVGGIITIITRQIFQRIKEQKELDEYKNL